MKSQPMVHQEKLMVSRAAAMPMTGRLVPVISAWRASMGYSVRERSSWFDGDWAHRRAGFPHGMPPGRELRSEVMRLGEALTNRADLQKRIAQLGARLQASGVVQEGDVPPEDPAALLAELDTSAPTQPG
jgi:hypothetical protein